MRAERPPKGFLVEQMQSAYEHVRKAADGLTDEEYFWEPVPGSWSVRRNHGENPPVIFTRTPNTRPWYIEEGWTGDGWLDPRPTTIGWLVAHLAACKVMYHDYAFGGADKSFADLVPSTAGDAIELLAEGQSSLARSLYDIEDGELDELRRTNWGERKPAWWIFWTMIEHDLQHGSEIGRMRDLHRSVPARVLR